MKKNFVRTGKTVYYYKRITIFDQTFNIMSELLEKMKANAQKKATEMAQLQLSVWNEEVEENFRRSGRNPAEAKARFEREAKGIFV